MDFLFELLFDIIVEGSIELGSEKSVPMPLRILAVLIVIAVFFGMGGLVVYMGLEAMSAGDNGAAIMMNTVGAIMVCGGIFTIFKMFRKKKQN